MSETGFAIGFPIDCPPLLPTPNASPEIFFQHLQASCQYLWGKSAPPLLLDGNFPAGVSSTVSANGMVPFQGGNKLHNKLLGARAVQPLQA